MKLHPLAQKAISRKSIIALTEQLVAEYIQEKRWNNPDDIRLDIQEMHELILYPASEYRLITSLELGYLEDEKVLGKTIPKEKTILIDSAIAPPNADPRYAFTFAHEYGHGILHSEQQELFRCSPKRIATSTHKDLHEIQANIFSEHLLMPDDLVKFKFQSCYKPSAPLRYFKRGEYWIEAFGVSRRVRIDSYTAYCEALAHPLRPYFSNVSITSLALKIHRLGLIQNYSGEAFFENPMGIKNIMRRMTLVN